MTKPKTPFSLVVKLACIAAHAEEMLSPSGHDFARGAIQGLLADPEVVAFLAHDYMRVFLPVKRSTK